MEETKKSIFFFSSLVLLVLFTSPAIAEECGCNGCHGNPPIAGNKFGGPDGLVVYPLTGATSAGAHAKHVPSTTGALQNDRCYVCHVNGMPYSPVCGNNQLQIGFGGSGSRYDGKRLNAPYSYEATGGTAITTGGTAQCSNLYCHSNGAGGTNNVALSGTPPLYDSRSIAPGTSPSWTSSGPLGCNFCHGYPPSYLTNNFKSNSHLIFEHQQTCNYCHYGTSADGATITNQANHANGIYNVQPDPSAAFNGTPVNFAYSYDPGGGRCSTVSCHPGAASMVWGNFNEFVAPLFPRNGSQCFEMIFDNVQFATPTDPPYAYYWDFGDGTIGNGFPASHIYGSAGPFTVILTGRDKDYHPFSKAVTVSPQGINAAPVVSKTLSLKKYTLTITDASYDPDCNACGHTGNGKIEITWDGVNKTTDTAVDLCSPSGKVYSRTYPTATANYSLKYNVTDNAGSLVATTNAISLPGPITISGKVTHANGTAYPNVTVYLFKAGGTAQTSAITDANGNYTLSRTWLFDCYDVGPVATGFTPTRQYNICDISSNVNFVGP